MEDISAAETNIFFKNGKWWLLTNIDSSEDDDHCSELHIFWNNNLFSKDWKTHKNNPVIFDSMIARNGGLILQDNEIYRVFQSQGWHNYGESFGVSKIVDISESTYLEEQLFEVKPNFYKKLKVLIHTVLKRG